MLKKKYVELDELKREMYFLEQLILKNEYVTNALAEESKKKNQEKRRKLWGNRKSLLKSAIGGVRNG